VDESFSHWLALREPLDVAARSGTLVDRLVESLPSRGPLRIVDLGTGTGSNVRYLMGRLPSRQHWLLVDYDADLLSEIPRRLTGWAASQRYETRTIDGSLWVSGGRLDCRIDSKRLDLSTLDPDLVVDRDLVTGSALLDLVSDRWLHQLASACAANRTAVLFALTYSGEARCDPADPDDQWVISLVNDHQRGDKGFGPAAGPEAAERAARAFEQGGFIVHREPSDWTLASDTTELQTRLLRGWQEAATEIAPDQSVRLQSWLERRLAHVAAGRSQIIVSHEDLAAWL
jgi:hypothetical protein